MGNYADCSGERPIKPPRWFPNAPGPYTPMSDLFDQPCSLSPSHVQICRYTHTTNNNTPKWCTANIQYYTQTLLINMLSLSHTHACSWPVDTDMWLALPWRPGFTVTRSGDHLLRVKVHQKRLSHVTQLIQQQQEQQHIDNQTTTT